MDEWEIEIEARLTALEYVLSTLLANGLAHQERANAEEFKESLLSTDGTLSGLMEADRLEAIKSSTRSHLSRIVKATSALEHTFRAR